ncbi:MAG: glycosyltransferase family 4 protein [Lachnospiraceae bacterium]|nr:glycosyltransferase family 4 protein [Lachnospiraceae bacterium]
MKIAIATVQIPFVSGGAEFLAQNLKTELAARGHDAEIVTIPFVDEPMHMISNHVMAARMMDLNYSWAGRVDLCIGLKFPAYCIPHSNKVNWILHQHRGAYDLFDTEYTNLRCDPDGLIMRQTIYNADNLYLMEAKRNYTIARNVSARLRRYNGIESTPLYHPCPEMEKFYCEGSEDYILMPSRISSTKRQMLALRAMCLTKSRIKLYLVGRADSEAERNRVISFIREHKLEDRVKYFDYVTQEEKFRLYANAKAVLFIPVDEDYGYITVEAMASSKPIITALDSGGPLEFVLDEQTGEVVVPEAEEIARAIDYMASSKYAAIEMGKRGKQHLIDMNISWDNVVKELTR